MEKIKRETSLAEILKYPEAEKILEKYNLPCLTCPFAKIELEELKIGQICDLYGIDCEKLLKDLNEAIR
jgi:hypothetical protein